MSTTERLNLIDAIDRVGIASNDLRGLLEAYVPDHDLSPAQQVVYDLVLAAVRRIPDELRAIKSGTGALPPPRSAT